MAKHRFLSDNRGKSGKASYVKGVGAMPRAGSKAAALLEARELFESRQIDIKEFMRLTAIANEIE